MCSLPEALSICMEKLVSVFHQMEQYNRLSAFYLSGKKGENFLTNGTVQASPVLGQQTTHFYVVQVWF